MATVYDYVRIVAFFAASIAAAYKGATTWFIFDGILSAIFGVALVFFPIWCCEFLVSSGVKLDSTHLFLTRETGCAFLVSALLMFLIRSSKDRNVIKSVLLSGVVSSALYTGRVVYGQFMYRNLFNDNYFLNELVGSLALLLSSVLCFMRYDGGLTGRDSGSRANIYFKYDSLLHFTFVAPDVVVPFVILGMMNTATGGFHDHLFSCLGGLNVGFAVLSWRAQTFRFNEDKRAVLYFRFMYHVLTMGCLVYGYMREGFVSNWFDLCFVAVGALPLVFIMGGLRLLRERTTGTSTAGYNLRSRN